MKYRLKFLNDLEHVVREFDLEAPDDAAAMDLACRHSIRAGLAVEVCYEARSVVRVTPMTARLYLSDTGKTQMRY